MRTSFSSSGDTPYGVPPFDKIRPEHYVPAFERAMSLNEAEVEAIASNNDEPTFENTLLAFDDAGRMLAQVELVFGMICAADTNEQLQAVQEQIMPRLAAHYDRILMNDRLFERVRALYDRRETPGTRCRAEMRLLEKTYRGFRACGRAARRGAEGAPEADQCRPVGHRREVRQQRAGRECGLRARTRRRTSKGCPSRCVTLRTRRPCSAV